MNYIIRAAHIDDAASIAPLLREADKREIAASTGVDPLSALQSSFCISTEVYLACRPDDTPLAIFGIGPNSSDAGVGIPWMVGTEEMIHYAIPLVRDARRWVDHQLTTYLYLTNYVDSRNSVHLKWLRHIGFYIDETPQYIGVDTSVPFYQFHRSNLSV